MTGRDLKNLKRADLLEILLNLSKENDDLKLQIQELQEDAENKKIWAQEMGSIAEASLQLNGVFAAAQEACDQYVENGRMVFSQSKKMCDRMEKKTREDCDSMLEDAASRCERMRNEAKQDCKRMREDARKKYEEMTNLARQQCDSIWKELYEQIKEASGYDFDMQCLLEERFRMEKEAEEEQPNTVGE